MIMTTANTYQLQVIEYDHADAPKMKHRGNAYPLHAICWKQEGAFNSPREVRAYVLFTPVNGYENWTVALYENGEETSVQNVNGGFYTSYTQAFESALLFAARTEEKKEE